MVGAACAKLMRVLSLASVLALAGCADSIEYNGKVFDMLGVNSTTKPRDARVSDRAPLVLPPDAKRLPTPGSQATAIAEQGLPEDVDRRTRELRAEAKKKELQARKDKSVLDPTAEPRPGILDRLIKGKRAPEDQEVEDVPEPDAGDAAPPAKTRTSTR